MDKTAPPSSEMRQKRQRKNKQPRFWNLFYVTPIRLGNGENSENLFFIVLSPLDAFMPEELAHAKEDGMLR